MTAARKLSARFVVAGCDASEMFDFVEEAFDEIAVAIEERARRPDVGRRLGIGLTLAQAPRCGRVLAQRVAIVGGIGEQDLALDQRVEHVAAARPSWAWPSVSLSAIGRPLGVDERMDLGGQAAPRATHATGSVVFFWALAAC